MMILPTGGPSSDSSAVLPRAVVPPQGTSLCRPSSHLPTMHFLLHTCFGGKRLPAFLADCFWEEPSYHCVLPFQNCAPTVSLSYDGDLWNTPATDYTPVTDILFLVSFRSLTWTRVAGLQEPGLRKRIPQQVKII